MGASIKSTPIISSGDDARVDIFAVGQDGAMRHKHEDQTWPDWKGFGGNRESGLSVVRTDHKIYIEVLEDERWSDFIVSSPSSNLYQVRTNPLV